MLWFYIISVFHLPGLWKIMHKTYFLKLLLYGMPYEHLLLVLGTWILHQILTKVHNRYIIVYLNISILKILTCWSLYRSVIKIVTF